jgi:hypothetical protein
MIPGRSKPSNYIYYSLILYPTLGLAVTPVQSQQNDLQHISIVAENDIYAPRGQDRHYSNGIRFGHSLQQETVDSWFAWLDSVSQFDKEPQSRQYELAIGQNIYTPEYFLTNKPLPGDRPYAGWIYSELSVSSNEPGKMEDVTINLGMVGPVTLAEQGQKLIHKLVGDPIPRGWDNQLRNEPTILLRYRRSWFLSLFELDSLKSDLMPEIGFNLGNVFTDAGIGTVFRIGNYLPERDIPLRIQPGLSGGISYIPVRQQQFDWMWFAEIQGRAVAQNIFLDGNTFVDSLSVEKRPFVHDLATGIVLGFGQLSLPVFFSFNVVWRGREFELQQGKDSFGSITVGIQY